MITSSILTGLISSIVYDGLKRPIKSIREQAVRNKEVGRALSQGTHPASPTAAHLPEPIDDLIRVIGNGEGRFDEDIDKFLREIQCSVIPDALKQLALCGKEHEPVFEAFNAIYLAHSPLKFQSRNLFEALFSAISTSISQSVGDPVLLEAFRAQFKDVNSSIENLTRSLSSRQKTKIIEAEEFNEIRLKVAKTIETSNKNVNIETTQGTKKVAIRKLVIPARLRLVSDENDVPLPHRDGRSDANKALSFMNFRRTFRDAVIIGDPGGGKTTLTQLLCFELSKQVSIGTATPDYEKLNPSDFQLPLRVILRTFEKRRIQNPSYTLFDYLVDDIRINCENCRDLANRFLQQVLHIGGAVIIFDGLDEILDVGPRRDMVALIEGFKSAYAACPTMITSRIVGYKDAPLSDTSQIFTLSRFNEGEVRKFSENLISSIDQIPLGVAKIKAEKFLTQTNASASDLRENPLLLGLMVYIFNSRGDVPSNRPEIYKECSLLMFEKWDQRRDINFQFPQDFDLLDLFGFLASKIFGKAETEDGVSEEWLSKRIREFFVLWYEDKAKSVQASKVLVDFITGRAWVMCEVGPGVFKFTHRTFLEYFFARRLEEEAGGVSKLVSQKLRGKIQKLEWDVVTHLALQIATFRSGPKSKQAIEALFKLIDREKITRGQQLNCLTFTARATEYLTIPEPLLREVVSRIFDKLVMERTRFGLENSEIIHELITANRGRKGFVADQIVKSAEAAIESTSAETRYALLSLLTVKFSGFRSPKRNGTISLHTVVWDTLGPVRESLRVDQKIRSMSNIVDAQYYVEIFGEDVEELFKIHGFDLLFQSNEEAFFHRPFPMGFQILIRAIGFVGRDKGYISDDIHLDKEGTFRIVNSVFSTYRTLLDDRRLYETLGENSKFEELLYITDIPSKLNVAFFPKKTTIKTYQTTGELIFILIHLSVDNLSFGSRFSELRSASDVLERLQHSAETFVELKKDLPITEDLKSALLLLKDKLSAA
jgi:hypothetical protein